MRKPILLALISLALAGTALAQSEPVRVPPGTATAIAVGTVVSFTSSELVVETPTARQRYVVDARSSIPMNLTSGTAVSVEFQRLDGGLQHAARVTPTTGPDHAATTGRSSGRTAPAGPHARDPKSPPSGRRVGLLGLVGLLSLGAGATLRACRSDF